jgi:4-hydroxyacetophenone monooxygenase
MRHDEVRWALADADVPLLLMVLVHLTADERWLRAPYLPQRDSRLFADESGGLPPEIQQEVREAALECIVRHGELGSPTTPELSSATLARMMSVCVGEDVAPEYVPLFLQDMGLCGGVLPQALGTVTDDFCVTVVGAGISGVCAAIMLHQLGIPFIVLEKNADLGGTWLENVYPEAGVDTPNHFYSFSFAPKADWQYYFSKQQQILDYIRACAVRFGVIDRIKFGVSVDELRYDESSQTWETRAGDEIFRSNAVITCVGLLNRPKLPNVEGLSEFADPVFHTARWPEGIDLTGKRVAIVGTGASAMQIARTVAEQAAQLTIFQRSPQWVVPNPDYHRTVSAAKQWLLQNVPFYAAWYRFSLFWRYADSLHPHLIVDPDWSEPERSVNARNEKHRQFLVRYIEAELAGRPDLLAKAVPTYPPYGKRMLLDNDWYATLRRDNVTLVDRGVERFGEHEIHTDDGETHAADVIILATGFHAQRAIWPLEIVGRDGLSIHEAWDADDPRAYLGITVPSFPNLFMLLGPNTGVGHGGSAIFNIEAQMRYVAQCIEHLVQRGLRALEPKIEVCEDYNVRMNDAHERMVFSHSGMSSWYKNSKGRVTAIMPWRAVDYWHMIRTPNFNDFIQTPANQGR